MSMADRPHGILEDIGAEIGYTATCALVDWFGGRSLYIPATADEQHELIPVIGKVAFVRMVKAFGSETLNLPADSQRETNRRDRLIASLLSMGHSPAFVARMSGLTERQVQNIRRRLEADGLMPLIIRRYGEAANDGGAA